MKKKPAKSSEHKSVASDSNQTLGDYLSYIRSMKKMTLREVEHETDKKVSNAYLSQLENNKIAKPSPNVLHALAVVYVIPYEKLMEKAGYTLATADPSMDVLRSAGSNQLVRVATFANESLTEEEEDKLLEYLAFLRSRKGKGRST